MQQQNSHRQLPGLGDVMKALACAFFYKGRTNRFNFGSLRISLVSRNSEKCTLMVRVVGQRAQRIFYIFNPLGAKGLTTDLVNQVSVEPPRWLTKAVETLSESNVARIAHHTDQL